MPDFSPKIEKPYNKAEMGEKQNWSIVKQDLMRITGVRKLRIPRYYTHSKQLTTPAKLQELRAMVVMTHE